MQGVSQQLQRRRNLIAELKSCKNLTKAKVIHENAVRCGEATNVYVGSTLISTYARCRNLIEAFKVFESLSNPDVVCWNALIVGHAENGEHQTSLYLFSIMKVAPDARTFVSVLKSCGNIALKASGRAKDSITRTGRALHLLIQRCECYSSSYLENTLVDMYGKFGIMSFAQRVFDDIEDPNIVCWTALISGYADNGQPMTALHFFSRMGREGFAPNARTFVAALKSCADLIEKDMNLKTMGECIHFLASVFGCDSDIYVQATLVDMYARSDCMEHACKIFELVEFPDVVCWNALIIGHADNGNADAATDVFSRMVASGCAPNARSFVGLLKANTDRALKEEGNGTFVKVQSLLSGKELHSRVSKSGFDSDIYVKGTLVDMYARCGSMVDSQRVFDTLKHPNVVCWNALILGYADNGQGKVALNLFWRMKREGYHPNSITFLASLKACGFLGALETGKALHAEICSRALETEPIVRNSLVDFYAKCGCLSEAYQLFDSYPVKDLVTWNALMAGYSRHGSYETVFNLFDKMQSRRIQPDGITFKCILSACSHAGLVDQGKEYFKTMARLSISPDVEHINCMIDLLGRSNKLDEAMVLLRSMPCSPTVVTWMTVLSACRKWKNVGLGGLAFESLDDGNAGAYVMKCRVLI